MTDFKLNTQNENISSSSKKTFEIIVGAGQPPDSFRITQVWIPWAKILEERTNGRIRVKIYPDGILCKDEAILTAVKNRVMDCGLTGQAYTLERFPLSSIMQLPGLNISSSNIGSRVFWDLYEEFPELRAEYADVHLMWLHCLPPYQIHSARSIRSLADLGGMKLTASKGIPSEVVSSLGAIPVNISAPEIRLALEKRIVNGTVFQWEGLQSFQLYDLLNYHIQLNIFNGPGMSVMNLETWNNFPSDIQEIINELGGAWGSDNWSKYDDEVGSSSFEFCQKSGQVINTLSVEDQLKLEAIIKPFQDKWVKAMELKGLPGKEVMEEAKRLSIKYSNLP